MQRILLNTLLLFLPLLLWANDTIRIKNPETWSYTELRPYVGKTVVFDCPMLITNNGWNGYSVGPRRIFAPTNQAYPLTPHYNETVSLNQYGQMKISGISGYHRMGEKIHHLTVKVNAINNLTMVDGEWYGNTRAELEKGIPYDELGDYSLLICTANLEYYLTVPNTDPTSSMGPSSDTEHKKQRAKVQKAMALIEADIYGFVEIESGDSALSEIAADLTSNTGRRYAYITDGTGINGTYTKAGFVYCVETVEPIGAIQNNGTVSNHRSQMQCFRERATGETFLVSENHFKAKSGSGSGLDADRGDGQGQYNYRRTQEAQSVVSQYNRFSKQLKEKDLLILGDLNAYAKEDPITVFTKAGYTDLHRAFHADSSYSYTYSGMAGYLDHAIATPTLLPQVTGMVAFHVNSDESDNYTYDKSNDQTMFRYSDHDPVLVGLRLDSTLSYEPHLSVNNLSLIQDQDQNIVISNALSLKADGQKSFYRLYTVSGWLVEQGEIVNPMHEVTRPKESGVYILCIYADGVVHQTKIIIP